KMEMFINEPDGEIVQNLPLKEPQKQRTPLLLEEQGSTERQQWRRGREVTTFILKISVSPRFSPRELC
ncbi:MAG: hypothetical protein KKE01_06425, partial [Candidatus Omnitrophica bacterium]|nr:hypothetical protein [Candidatus Omnitrophota bacterium]